MALSMNQEFFFFPLVCFFFFVHESNLPSTTRQFNTKLNVSTPYRYQTNSKREKYTKNRDTVQHDVSNKQINICTE